MADGAVNVEADTVGRMEKAECGMRSAEYSNRGARARNPVVWSGWEKSVAEEGETVPAFPKHPDEGGKGGEKEGAMQPAAGVKERVETAKARLAEGAVAAGGGGVLAAMLLATVLDVPAGGAAAVGKVLPPEMQGAPHEA